MSDAKNRPSGFETSYIAAEKIKRYFLYSFAEVTLFAAFLTMKNKSNLIKITGDVTSHNGFPCKFQFAV